MNEYIATLLQEIKHKLEKMYNKHNLWYLATGDSFHVHFSIDTITITGKEEII